MARGDGNKERGPPPRNVAKEGGVTGALYGGAASKREETRPQKWAACANAAERAQVL